MNSIISKIASKIKGKTKPMDAGTIALLIDKDAAIATSGVYDSR